MIVFGFLGVLFLAIGGAMGVIGVVQPWESHKGNYTMLVVLGTVFLVMAAIFIAIGWAAVRREARRKRLMATGLDGVGTITKAESTHMTVNEQPVIRLTLDYTAPGKPTYRITMLKVIPIFQVGKFQVGNALAVKFDPQQPGNMIIV
jgi:hypothetical protein